jgi:hypothetical protein
LLTGNPGKYSIEERRIYQEEKLEKKRVRKVGSADAKPRKIRIAEQTKAGIAPGLCLLSPNLSEADY